MKTVALILTSCARMDLLKKTLSSFFKWNSYPLYEVIVIEDSPLGKKTEKIVNQFDWKCKVKVLFNGKRLGQLASIEKAYSQCKSEYIFHCEDDWEFHRPGFIEESIELLEKDRQTFSVWLRDIQEYSSSLFSAENTSSSTKNRSNRKIIHEICSFNPSLRRFSDLHKYFPLIQYSGDFEKRISEVLEKKGMYSVLAKRSAVTHMGWHRRISSKNKEKSQYEFVIRMSIKRLKSFFYKLFKLKHYRKKEKAKVN